MQDGLSFVPVAPESRSGNDRLVGWTLPEFRPAIQVSESPNAAANAVLVEKLRNEIATNWGETTVNKTVRKRMSRKKNQ